MVTTRSQDRVSQDHATPSSPPSGRDNGHPKRKHGTDAAISGSPKSAKRRRSDGPAARHPTTEDVAVLDSQASDESSSRKLALRPHGSPDQPRSGVDGRAVVNPARSKRQEITTEAETQVVEETQLPSLKGTQSSEALEETLLTSPKSSSSMALPAYAQQVVESTQELDLPGTLDSEDADINVQERRVQPNGRAKQDVAASHRPLTKTNGAMQHSEMTQKHALNGAGSVKTQHVRFGSNEPGEPHPTITTSTKYKFVLSRTAEKAQAHVDASDEDDDAAPEAISQSAGHAQALAATTEATRAAKLKDRAEKAQRRRRDARLKAQAATRTRSTRPDRTTADDDDAAAADALARELLAHGPLPDELPEAIVRAHAGRKVPMPASARLRAKASEPDRARTKRPGSSGREKRPKDVVRAGRKVRVLREMQSALPPRTVARSRQVRERWLQGFRGDGSVAAGRNRVRRPLVVP